MNGFSHSDPVPLGEYEGTWCGYVLTIRGNNHVWYRLATKTGIRGFAKVKVVIHPNNTFEAHPISRQNGAQSSGKDL